MLDFIEGNKVRVILGKQQVLFAERLAKAARSRNIPCRNILTPLSRRNVLVQAIGPVNGIKLPKSMGMQKQQGDLADLSLIHI